MTRYILISLWWILAIAICVKSYLYGPELHDLTILVLLEVWIEVRMIRIEQNKIQFDMFKNSMLNKEYDID